MYHCITYFLRNANLTIIIFVANSHLETKYFFLGVTFIILIQYPYFQKHCQMMKMTYQRKKFRSRKVGGNLTQEVSSDHYYAVLGAKVKRTLQNKVLTDHNIDSTFLVVGVPTCYLPYDIKTCIKSVW